MNYIPIQQQRIKMKFGEKIHLQHQKEKFKFSEINLTKVYKTDTLKTTKYY